jgi:hypothetical protein
MIIFYLISLFSTPYLSLRFPQRMLLLLFLHLLGHYIYTYTSLLPLALILYDQFCLLA